MNGYIDVEPLSPKVQTVECWNCSNVWQAWHSKQLGACICPECYHGQGDNPRDYLELWYPELDRDTAKERQEALNKEMREKHGDVTVRL